MKYASEYEFHNFKFFNLIDQVKEKILFLNEADLDAFNIVHLQIYFSVL